MSISSMWSKAAQLILASIASLFVYAFQSSAVAAAAAAPTATRVLDEQYAAYLIRDSYNEVTTHTITYFNYRCKLTMQNCLFQTQWDRVFGKDKLPLVRTKREATKKKHNNVRRSSENSNDNNNNNYSFFYCQPFLVAKYCIDEYLVRSSVDNGACVNGSEGNLPNEFKRAIDKSECQSYIAYFFDSLSSGTASFSRYRYSSTTGCLLLVMTSLSVVFAVAFDSCFRFLSTLCGFSLVPFVRSLI